MIKYLGVINECSDAWIDVCMYNKELISQDYISATSMEYNISNYITDATNVNISNNTRETSSLST